MSKNATKLIRNRLITPFGEAYNFASTETRRNYFKKVTRKWGLHESKMKQRWTYFVLDLFAKSSNFHFDAGLQFCKYDNKTRCFQIGYVQMKFWWSSYETHLRYCPRYPLRQRRSNIRLPICFGFLLVQLLEGFRALTRAPAHTHTKVLKKLIFVQEEEYLVRML